MYLRNRKHFSCFYRVIETRVEVWEIENTSRRRVFPQIFRVLPNFHECFYTWIETRRRCFLFLLENSPRKITKNKENLIVLFIIKTYILYTTRYTRHLNLNFFVFLSSYRNTIINQSAPVFSLSYFLKMFRNSKMRLFLRGFRSLFRVHFTVQRFPPCTIYHKCLLLLNKKTVVCVLSM